MRALRAFLSAGRNAHGAGVTVPAGRGEAPGRVGRRTLLGAIAAAPVMAPAALQAAMMHEPFSSTIFFDVDWAEYGRACAAWFDANPEVAASAKIDGQLAGLDARLRATEASPHRLATAQVLAAEPNCALPAPAPRAFLDDVGSGP